MVYTPLGYSSGFRESLSLAFYVFTLNPAVSIFCLLQGLEAVKRICPKQVMLIGMGHVFDRHVDNGFLNQWSIRNVINNT
ncbi:hypothetical protein SDJN02_04475, partial [Cucurbita argyrosperma subsp. argyrosperma]